MLSFSRQIAASRWFLTLFSKSLYSRFLWLINKTVHTMLSALWASLFRIFSTSPYYLKIYNHNNFSASRASRFLINYFNPQNSNELFTRNQLFNTSISTNALCKRFKPKLTTIILAKKLTKSLILMSTMDFLLYGISLKWFVRALKVTSSTCLLNWITHLLAR